jgi:hypothetical protein
MHSTTHDLFIILAINLVAASPFLAFLLERRGFFGDRVRLVTVGQALAIPLGVGSMATGAVHLSALPLYTAQGAPVTLLYIGGGLFQLAWGYAWLRRPSYSRARIGAIGHVVMFVAWLVSRATGLPFGEHANVPELVGIADSFAAMFAGTVALGLFLTLWPPTRELLESRRLPPESASLGVLMAMVVTAMLTVFAIVSGMPEAVAHAH